MRNALGEFGLEGLIHSPTPVNQSVFESCEAVYDEIGANSNPATFAPSPSSGLPVQDALNRG